MYCYILDKSTNNWVESEDLYPHDIALLIDNENRIIYLYSGPEASNKQKELGEKLASELLKKYKLYDFQVLSDVIPIKIQMEIDLLMGDHLNESREKITRTLSMLIYLVLSTLIAITGLILLINTFRMLGWDKANNYYITSPETFNQFFTIFIIITWILISFSLVLIVIGVITKREMLIICPSIATLIAGAFLIYVRKREFLFTFTIEDLYYIARLELLFHIMWTLLALLAIFATLGISIYFILTETKKPEKITQNIEDIRKASRPTLLKDQEPPKMEEITE